MSDTASALQPAIEVLEQDYADLERKANGLLASINVLRERAGLPPRPSGWSTDSMAKHSSDAKASSIKLHSDSFTGKKLGAAVREYLSMRKAAGQDPPATSREIFDALKQGGFASGAKDNATAMVVLRTMLRKNTTVFAKLPNGKYGLRAWYPNLRPAKGAAPTEEAGETATSGAAEAEPEEEMEAAASSDQDKATAA